MRTIEEWKNFCYNKGTSGDMVFDILADWEKDLPNIINSKIYIVIGYDSILDCEEVRSIWFDKAKAEIYRDKHRCLRVEDHKIEDWGVAQ